MLRSIAHLSVSIALTIAGASVANAQAAGAAGPLPGTGDSTKISSGNRENNAEYNHLISAGDPKAKASDDHVAKSTPVPATAADFKVGSPLRDIAGVPIGTISEIDPDGIIVDTGTDKIKVPAMGFGKDNRGLVLNLTAAAFKQAIAKAHAAHAAHAAQ